MNRSDTFRSLCNTPDSFRQLLTLYVALIWGGWKQAKAKEMAAGTFKGVVPEEGLVVLRADGTERKLTQFDRVRVRDLHPDSLAKLGVPQDTNPSKDVFHPEFVADYEALVKKSGLPGAANYVANNAVGAATVICFLADQVADDSLTQQEMAERIERLLSGEDRETVRAMNQATRMGWMGRVVGDLSYLTNKDFVPTFALEADAYAIDEYVVKPVLTALCDDLKSGKFNKS